MNQNEQEKTNQAVGKQTIRFACPPAILSRASIVGDMEGQGPLASYFDQIEPDPAFGMDSWEEGESEMVRRAVQTAITKSGIQGEYPLYLWWRSAWTVDRFYIRSERFSDTYLRSVWCLLHLWRSIVTCSYDCQCRLCLACHCRDKQSLRWCRKTVPVSTGIRQPAPTLFYLDSHWKRRIPCICNQSRSADERIPSHHFCDNRKNR